MKSYKQVSEYYSEDKKRTASIRVELGTKRYVVTVVNDSGSAFTSSFETEEDAEQFAENWVTE